MVGTCAEEGLSKAGHQIRSGQSRQPSRRWVLPYCDPWERVGGEGVLFSSSCRRPTQEWCTPPSSPLLSFLLDFLHARCGRGPSRGDHWPHKLDPDRQNMGRHAHHSHGWWTPRLLVFRWRAICMWPKDCFGWVGLQAGRALRQRTEDHSDWSAC